MLCYDKGNNSKTVRDDTEGWVRHARQAAAARILIQSLVSQGVDHVFCVPGESYLAALDAMHDRKIVVTVCRQEGGAAMMAEAAGKKHGPSRHLLRDQGAGRDQRIGRHTYRSSRIRHR